VEPKLRTVIWSFGGEPISTATLDGLRRFVEAPFPKALGTLISAPEQEALLARAVAVLDNGRFPIDESGYRYPWPLV